MHGSEARQWQGRTDGTPWMHRALIGMMSVIPLWLMYVPMFLAVPFYLVFNRKGCLAIYHYFRRRLGFGRLRSFFCTWGNHLLFGMVVMDKFASYSGTRFKVTVENDALFAALASGESGFMMFGAHIGNDEIGGFSLRTPKRMNVLAFGGESSAISENREKILASNNIRLILAQEDLSHLLLVNKALSAGEILSIHADRVFGSPKTVRCRFMGAYAELPAGPFALAEMREIPAISMFVVKQSLYGYRIFLGRIDTGSPGQDRAGRISSMACSYCEEMEKVLGKHPAQWFNFYEFWND